MPVTPSAKKALRRDRRRTQFNKPVKAQALKALKVVRLDPKKESIKLAYSALDKAGKKGILKKGKINRLKSRLAKLSKKTVKSPTKTS